jgi:hypothetical protein
MNTNADTFQELLSNEKVQEGLKPVLFMLLHGGLIYGRTSKGVAVLQKIARGESINKRDAYRLVVMASSLIVLARTTNHQTDEYLEVLDKLKSPERTGSFR